MQIADQVEFLAPIILTVLPERKIEDAQDTATTVSALNKERIQFSNTGAVTITDFTKGQEGQELVILGDGFTTVTHGTKIKTNTAANKLLLANTIYHFVRFNDLWVEIAGSGTLTAGDGISVSGSTVTNKYVGKYLAHFNGADTQPNNSGTLTDFPNAVRRYVCVADLTGMTQYRVCLSTSTPSGQSITVDPQYSTNGTAWTAFSSSIAITPATGVGVKVSAFVSLPAGARIATSYITVQLATNEDVVVYSIGLEFKP